MSISQDEQDMSMIEILSEELGEKELKIMELEKQIQDEKEKGKELSCAFHDLMIEFIKLSCRSDTPIFEDGVELSNAWDSVDYRGTITTILDEMNAEDWNDDDGHCSLTWNPIGMHGMDITAEVAEDE